MKKAVAAFAFAMSLVATVAPPAAAADQHVILFKDEGSSGESCYDKQVWVTVENTSNGDVTYICFDYPGPL